MAERQRVSSGSLYESQFGFSRAVRVDDRVFVAGTAAIEPDGSTTHGGMAAQTSRCLAIVETALIEAGASLSDVVRTRIFVTDMTRWEEAATTHAEAFHDVRPAATIVQVAALVAPEMLVEMEAEAVIGSAEDSADDSSHLRGSG